MQPKDSLVTSTIYKITNKINGKVYIGQTVRSLTERFSQHKYNSNSEGHNAQAVSGAMKKYGPENFSIEALLICDHKDAHFYETLLIEGMGTKAPLGYNLRVGIPSNVGPYSHKRVRGESHGCAKLSEDDVLNIRENTHWSTADVVEMFSIDRHTVVNIRKGRTWTHSFDDKYLSYQYRQGEMPRGENHHASVLSDTDRTFIQNDTETPSLELAERFGVSIATVQLIRKVRQSGVRIKRKCDSPSDKVQFVLDNPDISNARLKTLTGLSLSTVSNIKSRKMHKHFTSNATEEQWAVYLARKEKYKPKGK